MHPFTPSDDYLSHQTETDVEVHHSNSTPLLSARRLRAAYADRQVLIDVDVEVFRGECLALVGESGCGKTTFARTLVGLGEQVSGELSFNSSVLPPRVHDRDAKTRSAIQYVFQNPYRALNPTQSVGQILTTTIRHFFDVTKQEADKRALAALERVALRRNCLNLYPRELSGGERQRIAIARALVCEPEVLICDEITSALDVSIQATILKLLRSLQEDGLAILFVTHDLGVVHSIADRVVVLQHGRVVESGSVSQVLTEPNHPYTRELLRNSPALSRAQELSAAN